ncbi:hypothetical protein ACOQFB_18505 [Anaeromyxobacter sp. Red801]|uniref:hypothetical protein n=1 Tax=Anaeromyxobacter sp. Red801 TaxID=3411632 RepID=UPI003BA07668
MQKSYVRIENVLARQEANEQVFVKPPTVLSLLKVQAVMIESHGCDIDRQGDVCGWLVRPLNALSAKQQDSVRAGDNGSLMFLQPTGTVPDAAVDFNAAVKIPAWFLGESSSFMNVSLGREEKALMPFREVIESRVLSLSGKGLKTLYERKIRHLTRIEIELDEEPEIVDEASRPNAPHPVRGWTVVAPKWLTRSMSSAA